MVKIRVDIMVDENILGKFREKFVRKKGDLSSSIENLMIKSMGFKR